MYAIRSYYDIYAEMYATDLSDEEQYADKTDEEIKAIALENLDVFFAENNYGVTKQDVIDNTETSKALDTVITSYSIHYTKLYEYCH